MDKQAKRGDEIRQVETSSIVVNMPDDYTKLAADFTLARYAIQPDMRFDDVHLDLQRQLTRPYRVWWPDRGIYVLWRPDETPVSLSLGQQQVVPDLIKFSAIPIHLIVKLLMEEYFRGDTSFFTGQGKRFLFVKWEQRRNSALCLEFDIKAAEGVEPDDPEQEFTLLASARRFRHHVAEQIRPGRYIYYSRTFASDGAMTMQMLTREDVALRMARGEGLWNPWAGRDTPARLEFFSEKDVESSRGYLLHSFCQQFAQRLNAFGIPARLKTRSFVCFPASGPERGSSLDLLLAGSRFYVLDARHRQSISISYYVERFSEWFERCSFELIDKDHLHQTSEGATLVLMDAEEYAYEELLAATALQDPYPTLYLAAPDIPLQGFNVNPNALDSRQLDADAYLSYGRWTESEEEDFEQHGQLTVRDALLKHMLLRQQPLSRVLPHTPALGRYAFVYRGLYRGVRYTALLHVQGDIPQVSSVGGNSRDTLEQVCAEYGIQWDAVEDAMNARRSTLLKGGFDPTREYDFLVVVGNGVASEIVDVPEYAFHQFDEILRRSEERDPQPLDFFLLMPYFEAYAAEKGWPGQAAIERGAPESSEDDLPPGYGVARVVLRQLQQHDAFIHDLSIGLDRISYRDLQGREDYQRMLQSVSLSPYTVGRVFKAGGHLLNPRGTDVIFYTGIWFDNSDQTYMVGSPESINQVQKNALTLRRFEPLIGRGVNLNDMLQLMAVGFVRLGQYTVLPYPFKLLRLYIENYLHWALRGKV